MRSSRRIVFKTPYTLVSEDAFTLTIRGRNTVLFGIAASCLFVCGLSAAEARYQIVSSPAMAMFCRWSAAVLLVIAVSLIVMGILSGLRSETSINFATGKIRRGAKTYPLSSLQRITVGSIAFGGGRIHYLSAVIDGKTLRIASGTEADHVAGIADYLKKRLERKSPSAADDARETTGAWAGEHLAGIVLVALGLTVSVSGYFLLPGIIISHGARGHGPLMWPVGICFVIIAAFDFAGYPLHKMSVGKERIIKSAILLAIFSVYAFALWR